MRLLAETPQPPPSPRIWLHWYIYEGDIGQPRLTTSFCDPCFRRFPADVKYLHLLSVWQMTSRILRSMSAKDEAGSQIKGPVPKDERQNVRIKGSVLKKPPLAAERTRESPNVSEITEGRLKSTMQVNRVRNC
jgi:hypothetical protein